ncbi:MAG: Ig-like domain-containing protein [Gammaproteobacteria bacterium]|nr:Ig-like domain-containing protein [Gammaproteobacteria bacterium]
MSEPSRRSTTSLVTLLLGAAVWVVSCENPLSPELCGTIPVQTIAVGGTVDVAPCFRDPNGEALVFAAFSSDTGVATVQVTGSTVTVTAVSPGTAVVTVVATDPGGLEARQTFQVVVPDRPPTAVGTIDDRELMVGDSAVVDVRGHFTEPDGQPLRYSAAADPSHLAVSVEGTVVTVVALAKGTAVVTVTATDPGGLAATQRFEVTVPNRPPFAVDSIAAREVMVDRADTLELSPFFGDPDGDPLTWAAAASDGAVVGTAVAGSTLTLTGLAKGEATVTVTATDDEGLTAEQSFTVTVPNRPPVATDTIPSRMLYKSEADTLRLAAWFSDPDGDPLTWAAQASTPGVVALDLAAGEGTLAITPLGGGETVVTVTATDDEGLTASQSFTVTVPNRPPVATDTIPSRMLHKSEADTIDLTAHFSDPDEEPLTYAAATSNGSVVALEVSAGAGTLIVTSLSQGEAVVTVTATDPEGLTASQSFTVAVPNRGPAATASIPAQTLYKRETAPLDFTRHFSDPDGDILRVEIASSDGLVATATASGTTLEVRAGMAGEATLTVTVIDPGGLSAEQSFAVTVLNRGPVATTPIPAQTLPRGPSRTLGMAAHFSDPDGDALSYSASSSDPRVVRVRVDGSDLILTAWRVGTVEVTVTATDPDGLTAAQEFPVDVPRTDAGFEIQLGFASGVGADVESAVRSAAATWEAIVRDTEFADVAVNDTISCRIAEEVIDVELGHLDDLAIVVGVQTGEAGGTLALASTCARRVAGGEPALGVILFDNTDAGRLARTGNLFEVAMHEIAHVLGIGLGENWRSSIANPSDALSDADTHFPGFRAVAAFNAAGGARYTGGKVPVENGGDDAHWRESAMGAENMTPALTVGAANPLSAITIQALADLGYSVNAGLAEAYIVPSPALAAAAAEDAPTIDLGNDVYRGPIVEIDGEGNTVRVVPGEDVAQPPATSGRAAVARIPSPRDPT